MNKKFISALLIIAIIFQLSVPVGMIAHKSIIKNHIYTSDTEVTLLINIEFSDENLVFFHPVGSWVDDGSKYYTIEKAENGINDLKGTNMRPIAQEYIKASAFYNSDNCTFLCEEFDYFKLCDYGIIFDDSNYKVTAKYKVYNGEILLVGVYIDDIPINEWYAEFSKSI